jgi:hypothetical protein
MSGPPASLRVLPPPHSEHHLRVHEALALLETDRERGLSGEEAARRLERYGLNVLPRVERRSWPMRLLLQFHHPLIYVLLVSAAATYAIGAPVDASVIVGVVLANAAVGFAQEARAEHALDALAEMITVETRVTHAAVPPATPPRPPAHAPHPAAHRRADAPTRCGRGGAREAQDAAVATPRSRGLPLWRHNTPQPIQ